MLAERALLTKNARIGVMRFILVWCLEVVGEMDVGWGRCHH